MTLPTNCRRARCSIVNPLLFVAHRNRCQHAVANLREMPGMGCAKLLNVRQQEQWEAKAQSENPIRPGPRTGPHLLMVVVNEILLEPLRRSNSGSRHRAPPPPGLRL